MAADNHNFTRPILSGGGGGGGGVTVEYINERKTGVKRKLLLGR